LEKITEILKPFKKISLTDLNSVKLLDRTDIKFATSVFKLSYLLKHLSADYKVLSINNEYEFPYKTLYYDTPDLAMYLKHHNGNLNRFKIRERAYMNNEKRFLEVKFKNNKGRTIKERILRTETNNDFSATEASFIQEKTPYSANLLEAKVLVNYSRITLVNKDNTEKITIDSDIRFSGNDLNQEMKNLIIVEVKQSVRSRSAILSILRSLKIPQVSFSKYCLGINFLYPNVKKNNFKEKLITLNKIINDTSFIHIADI
jgi:hypothetical protein